MDTQQEFYLLAHLDLFASKDAIKEWYHTASEEELLEEAELREEEDYYSTWEGWWDEVLAYGYVFRVKRTSDCKRWMHYQDDEATYYPVIQDTKEDEQEIWWDTRPSGCPDPISYNQGKRSFIDADEEELQTKWQEYYGIPSHSFEIQGATPAYPLTFDKLWAMLELESKDEDDEEDEE